MPTTIETGTDGIYDVPEVTIFIADKLAEAEFEEVPYLRLDRLRIAAAPEVDVCQMHYEYGTICREGEVSQEHYPPLSLVGKFVKIEIEATVQDDEPILWYGVIEADSKNVIGSDGTDPAGFQQVTAFGLLRLLEKTYIKHSWVEDGAGGVTKINTGLQFNFDIGGQFPVAANMSESEVLGTHVFSWAPRSSAAWGAYRAVEYLLKYCAPKESDETTDANQWEFEDATEASSILNWYSVVVPTELRSVKSVIDELIDRRRGVSYYAYFDSENDTVKIKPFSFVPSDITLPGGDTLAANPNQYTLDFEQAIDIQEAIVSDVATAQYHRVRVYGEFITSTFTQWIGNATNPMLVQDWATADETGYLAGASLRPDGTPCPDYTALTDDTIKSRWNALARASDKYRHVFRRFKVDSDWDQKTFPWHEGVAGSYWALPKISDIAISVDASTDTGEKEPTWHRGIHIQRHLPFLDRCDYSEDRIESEAFTTVANDDLPEYVPILAYACVDGLSSDPVRDSDGAYIDDSPRFEQVEKLNYSAFDEIGGFRWGCHVHVDQVKPAVSLVAHPAQMLAKDVWAAGSPEPTDPSQDPALMNGINPEDLYVTMSVSYQRRVQRTIDISTPPAGSPISELVIYAKGMRADYVVPYTTVGIVSGKPIVTTTGGFVRDDRLKVGDIARCAAEWYGDERKTLSLTYKQVRNLFELGWLITDIGPNYAAGPQQIKTPITAIDYVFPNANIAPTTRIETAFAELDVR